jgi:hypothetical protein
MVPVRKHLFGGQNTSRRTTITPKTPPEAAEHRQRTLYVSSATIVNNNVDYAKRTENNAGVALQLSRLKTQLSKLHVPSGNCQSKRFARLLQLCWMSYKPRSDHPAKRGSSMPGMPVLRQNKSPDWGYCSFCCLLSPRWAEVM